MENNGRTDFEQEEIKEMNEKLFKKNMRTAQLTSISIGIVCIPVLIKSVLFLLGK
ncbi:hypothetical protein [Enterococcus sp. HY326]|uniref:hypothetical protein n=1 Tax=Enterococcus sp. HY326 TaxID=2971265 RepID=UPI0022406554|nr:hypothetical protein [Enterococcus sp. HY326]